jgi:hypothetical protein
VRERQKWQLAGAQERMSSFLAPLLLFAHSQDDAAHTSVGGAIVLSDTAIGFPLLDTAQDIGPLIAGNSVVGMSRAGAILVYTSKSSADYAQSNDPFSHALDYPAAISLSQHHPAPEAPQ